MPAMRNGDEQAVLEEPARGGTAAVTEPREPFVSGRITWLRWLAIVLPLVFISALNYLLHTELEAFHDFPEVLAVLALLTLGIAAFSFAVFGTVARLERGILERNAMLTALVEVGRGAGYSLELDELLSRSLDAILEVTSGEAAEIWLTDDDGELVLVHHRGLPSEVFRERVRLRFGEGLPGLAAQEGQTLVVHELHSDSRFVRSRIQELGFESFCALPLRHRGETYGVLCVIARDPDAVCGEMERDLLEGIGERLAVAIENARLHERVLDAAVLQERERIARELHDGLAQILGYINTQTLAVRKLLDSGRVDDAKEQLGSMEEAAKRVYADVREGIFSLRTPVSAQDGLPEAVRAHLRNYREMPGAPEELRVDETAEVPPLPPSTEIQLMRVVQEALNNVRKHAESSQATVGFSVRDGELVVSVADNGRGFRPEQRMRTGWPHFGLQTMRERAEAVGGRFEIESQPGAGTVVRVRVPVADANGSPA